MEQCVCFGLFSFNRYSVVKRADSSQMLLLAADRTASLASLLGTELETVATFTGNVNTPATGLNPLTAVIRRVWFYYTCLLFF